MLVSEITHSAIPALHYDDTVEEAIALLEQNNVQHLPVLNEDKYEGTATIRPREIRESPNAPEPDSGTDGGEIDSKLRRPAPWLRPHSHHPTPFVFGRSRSRLHTMTR